MIQILIRVIYDTKRANAIRSGGPIRLAYTDRREFKAMSKDWINRIIEIIIILAGVLIELEVIKR